MEMSGDGRDCLLLPWPKKRKEFELEFELEFGQTKEVNGLPAQSYLFKWTNIIRS